MAEESIVSSVRKYLRAVNRAGIHARQAVLFGSHARGEARPDSDIDIIVIAPEFDGPPDRNKLDLLWRLRVSTDARIEPIPCGERQWIADDSRIVLEIARTEGETITLEPAA